MKLTIYCVENNGSHENRHLEPLWLVVPIFLVPAVFSKLLFHSGFIKKLTSKTFFNQAPIMGPLLRCC